jgi:hypothetical protein
VSSNLPTKPTKFLPYLTFRLCISQDSARHQTDIKQQLQYFFLISPLLLKLQKVHKKKYFEIFNFTAAEKKNRTYLFVQVNSLYSFGIQTFLFQTSIPP